MTIIAEIIEIIKEKQTLFKEYELLTFNAINAEPSELSEMLEKRMTLIEQIDAKDAKILELAKNYGDVDLLFAVMKNKCNHSETPVDLLPLFDCAQQLFVILNRIMEHEKELVINIESRRKSIRANIKSTNQKSKIASFLPRPAPGVIINKKG